MNKERARYRRIVTTIHDDEWFHLLSPGARNLYLNMIPRVGTCGAHNASIGWLAKLAGYENSFIPMWLAKIITKRHLKQLSSKVRYWPDEEVIWIMNFTKLQGSGVKFLAGAVKHARNFPAHISDEIVLALNPDISTNNTVKHTPSDTLSDGSSDTHGRVGAWVGGQAGAQAGGREQSSRVAEEQSTTHSLTHRASEIEILISEYKNRFSNGMEITPSAIAPDDSLSKSITEALTNHDLRYWLDVIERASGSDFLSGKSERPFELRIGWLLNPLNSQKILSGEYDNFNARTIKPSSGGNI